MKMIQIIKPILGTFTVALCWVLFTGKSVIAQTVNGWDYTIDSFNDGYDGFNFIPDRVGQNSSYEIDGLAFKEDGNNIIIALNGNMSLDGDPATDAQRGNVNWGDLFFNFSGDNFNTASNSSNLYAIRFSQQNDSNASTPGVYRNVQAKSVTSSNYGFPDLNYYSSRVQSAGGTVTYGDLSADTSYFDHTSPVLNVIDTYDPNFFAPISFLTSDEISNSGLNFSQYGATGSQTIAFSFDRTALPVGDFIANIFAECANDGIALRGKTEEVPEPLTILGSIAGIGYIWQRQRSQRNQEGSADRT